MPDTLPVHLNRDGTQDIESAPSFEAAGSFAVVLHNHGSPTHVHLRLSDDLAAVTALGTTNHYVEGGSARRVDVAVETDDWPVEGDLEVLTRFGANSATVAVDVVEPEGGTAGVHVDDSLGSPGAGDPEPEPRPALPPWLVEYGPMAALATVAVLVAVAAVLASDALSVLVGLLVVLAGLVAAAVFLRRPA